MEIGFLHRNTLEINTAGFSFVVEAERRKAFGEVYLDPVEVFIASMVWQVVVNR